MKDSLRTLLCFALFLGAVALAIFLFTPPNSTWYLSTTKPDFAPPGIIFATALIVLSLLLVLALARAWTLPREKRRRRWFFAFGSQLLFITLWLLLFFIFHSLTLCLVDVLLLWLATLVLTLDSYELDRVTFWLLVPYFACCTFILMLTTVTWWIN